MTIIACGQNDVLGEECPGCGGWLHRQVGGRARWPLLPAVDAA